MSTHIVHVSQTSIARAERLQKEADEIIISASATIEGRRYHSDSLSGGEGFDVVIDGEVYTNPFYTDCRVCGDLFPEFWQAFRQANNLYISADGVRSRLPTKNIDSVIAPLDSPENSCASAW